MGYNYGDSNSNLGKLFYHFSFSVWLISFCKQVSICFTTDLLLKISCHRMSLLLCKVHTNILVIQKRLCVAFFGRLLVIYQVLGRLGGMEQLLLQVPDNPAFTTLREHTNVITCHYLHSLLSCTEI